MNSLLSTADLLRITGYERAGDMARRLREQGIKLFEGKDGPWTTLELVNAAGGIVPTPAANGDAYRPEDIA